MPRGNFASAGESQAASSNPHKQVILLRCEPKTRPSAAKWTATFAALSLLCFLGAPTAAPAQHLPVLPAGVNAVRQEPISEMRPDLLRFPVRTGADFPRRQLDQARIDRTSAQLENLFNAVRPELREASSGELPKGLIPHLKRIQKLAKQLRREMAP